MAVLIAGPTEESVGGPAGEPVRTNKHGGDAIVAIARVPDSAPEEVKMMKRGLLIAAAALAVAG